MDRILNSILVIDGGIQEQRYSFVLDMPPSKACKYISRHLSWWWLGSLKIESKSLAGTPLYHIFSKSYLKKCKITIGYSEYEIHSPAEIIELKPK